MVTAIILVSVERDLILDVIDEILKVDGIMEVHSVAGEYDLAAIARVADNQQLSALADRLSKPFTMDYYIPEKPLKTEYKQRLTIRCADGFTYVLSLAEGTSQYDIVSLSVQYDPKRVLRFPGETDPQYQRRLQGLKQRFEFENRYSSGQLFKTGKELSKLLDAVPEKTARIKGKRGVGPEK